MVVYAGRNMDRSYKDTYHASDPEDMEHISKLCNSISTTLSGATDIKFARFSSKFKTGTQREIWEIWVTKPAGTYKYFYDFVTLDTTLYLIETY